jgi:hypothetical protein
VSANEYSCALGAQINFGDLTPYITYGGNTKTVLWLRFILSNSAPQFCQEPELLQNKSGSHRIPKLVIMNVDEDTLFWITI